MPDSFFYETNRTAFSICATCQRSCGLSASPRATTCAVGAGRAFKPSALRRRAEPHRRAVRKRGKPLLSVFRSYPPYIENRAVGLSLPVRHFVMKLPDYGRGRICRAANRLHAGTLPHPARQHRRRCGFQPFPLRTPSLALLYEATHRYREFFVLSLSVARLLFSARRAEIRSTLHNAGFVFYETNRTAFLICATCRHSCGLSASPRATTCAACAGLGISRRLLQAPAVQQHRRHADFWLYAFIGFKDPRSCLRVPSLGISYRDSTPAPSDEADAENRIPNAGIRRIGLLSHSLSFLLEILLSDSPVKRR